MIAKSDEHGIDEQMTKNKETRKATHFQPTSSHFTSPFANHFGTLKFPSNAAVPTWAIRIQSSMIEWATGKIFLAKKKHRTKIFTNLQPFWIHLFRFIFRRRQVTFALATCLAFCSKPPEGGWRSTWAPQRGLGGRSGDHTGPVLFQPAW